MSVNVEIDTHHQNRLPEPIAKALGRVPVESEGQRRAVSAGDDVAGALPRARGAGNRAMITVSIMLATIMQVLDTTIANVALPHMQGSLSATQDQIAWVLTSYIVAAAIMTPLTGWLAGRFGRKRLFLVSVVGFTVASMLCGAAQSLAQIVLFRLLQGVFGAALVPLSQAVLLDIYPREQHGQAMAIWGVGVMVGPILGPDARRLAHRELQLALGVLHQPAGRHAGVPRHPRLRRTSTVPSTRGRSISSASPC